MEKIWTTSLQRKIEYATTNGVSFKNTPKHFSIEPDKVNTLLGLRMYLSAMEINVSINTRNFENFHLASTYLDSLSYINRWSSSYHEHFDLNSSKGIDEALKNYVEDIARFFRTVCNAA